MYKPTMRPDAPADPLCELRSPELDGGYYKLVASERVVEDPVVLIARQSFLGSRTDANRTELERRESGQTEGHRVHVLQR